MANYGENYVYGESPTYKDDGQEGVILVSSVDSDTGDITPTDFPILDIVPSSYKFGYTGLFFVPKRVSWDFGDGTSSSDPDPTHTYNTHGYHDVQLSIMDNGGHWYRVAAIYRHHIALGKMDFSGDPLRGDKPLTVTFEDENYAPTGSSYTGMQWDFGDTYGATGMNPSPHTYLDYGSYTVEIDATLDTI